MIQTLAQALHCHIAEVSIEFIDSAALAFLAQEAGCIVTTLDGNPPPPLYTCENYRRTGLITAATASVHQHLLDAVQAAIWPRIDLTCVTMSSTYLIGTGLSK